MIKCLLKDMPQASMLYNILLQRIPTKENLWIQGSIDGKLNYYIALLTENFWNEIFFLDILTKPKVIPQRYNIHKSQFIKKLSEIFLVWTYSMLTRFGRLL